MTSNERENDRRRITRSRYDPEGETSLATALVLAIAEAKEVDPLDYSEMSPLGDYFDAAALEEAFFDPAAGDDRGEPTAVTFTYGACEVVIRDDGRISVYAPTDS